MVILCGGYGMRMKDAADGTPKPLSMVGGKPILWHIMKLYSNYGFNEFILPLGYRGDKIKEFFVEYDWRYNDFVMDIQDGENKIHFLSKPEKWKITFIDTGPDTMTGGRIKRIEPYIEGDTFMLTYGDGLCSVDINKLIEFHYEKKRIATLTGVKKKSQYGILKVEDGIAISFNEKTDIEGIINGGFFVLEKEVFNYVNGDSCIFEQEPLKKLSSEGQLAVYEHDGFWEAVDTYKDLKGLNDKWKTVKEILKI
ncbi:MAG: sugar phosphate nucleotidyltransferase [Caulobacteraceae bacterium]